MNDPFTCLALWHPEEQKGKGRHTTIFTKRACSMKHCIFLKKYFEVLMSLVFFTRYNSFRAYDNLKRERCMLRALFHYNYLEHKLKDKRIVMFTNEDLSQDAITHDPFALVVHIILSLCV